MLGFLNKNKNVLLKECKNYILKEGFCLANIHPRIQLNDAQNTLPPV